MKETVDKLMLSLPLQEEVEKLVHQIDAQKKLSSDFGSLLDSKEEIITDLEIHLEATKIELKNTKDIAEKHGLVLQEIRNQIKDLETAEKSVQNQLSEEREANNKVARSHADRIMTLEQQELALKEEAEQKDENLQSSVSRCEGLEQLVEKLKVEVSNVNEEFERTVSYIKHTKEKEICELRETVSRVKEERDTLGKHVGDQTDQISWLTDKVALLCREKECIQTKMAASELDYKKIIKEQLEVMEKVNTKVEALCKEKMELLRQLEQVALDRDVASQELQQVTENLESVTTTAAQKEADWADDFQRLTDTLKAITEEKEALEQKLAQTTAQRTGLSEYVEELKTELDVQKSKLEEITQQISEDVVKLASDLDCVKCKVETEQTNCRSLQRENDSLMSEIDYLQKSSEKQKIELATEGKEREEQITRLTTEKGGYV